MLADVVDLGRSTKRKGSPPAPLPPCVEATPPKHHRKKKPAKQEHAAPKKHAASKPTKKRAAAAPKTTPTKKHHTTPRTPSQGKHPTGQTWTIRMVSNRRRKTAHGYVRSICIEYPD